MPPIEIRITAIPGPLPKRSFDESKAFYIKNFSPVSAAGILNRLRDMSAIKAYVREHNISANADRLPTIISPLNELGEFSISLPCPENSDQVFIIKIAN